LFNFVFFCWEIYKGRVDKCPHLCRVCFYKEPKYSGASQSSLPRAALHTVLDSWLCLSPIMMALSSKSLSILELSQALPLKSSSAWNWNFGFYSVNQSFLSPSTSGKPSQITFQFRLLLRYLISFFSCPSLPPPTWFSHFFLILWQHLPFLVYNIFKAFMNTCLYNIGC